MTTRCRFCETAPLEYNYDFGALPLCNRFLRSATEGEDLFALAIAACTQCGLIQLSKSAPRDELRSRFDWIRYNEPQAHLESLVTRLTALPNIAPDSRVGAIVFGEDTTLDCFSKRGFANSWRIDPSRDLKNKAANAGVETIQQLDQAHATKILAQKGKFDLLIVRHILEHAHQPLAFAKGVETLIKPDGYVVFEVPDCQKAFELCDYTILWEEHISYFTTATFEACLRSAGFNVIELKHISPSLVAIVRPSTKENRHPRPMTDKSPDQAELLHKFVDLFPTRRADVQQHLRKIREQMGKIAFFGAGHLGCIYINLMRLNGMVEFVVDDDVNKKGLWMPGSHLPILNAGNLTKDIRVCLSALSEKAEKRIAEQLPVFRDGYCRFISIFPDRDNSLVCV